MSQQICHDLNLFGGGSDENGDPVFNLGQEAIAVAKTNDEQVTKVLLSWIDPNNDIAKSESFDLPGGGSAQSTFTPDKVGDWLVRADFSDGTVLIEIVHVPFLVVPESPIGMVALMASSFLALGGFMLWKTRRKVH